jgi:hypothetical protein
MTKENKSFNPKQFYSCLETYSSLFDAVSNIRKELDAYREADPESLNKIEKKRIESLVEHMKAFTDFQSFLMQQTHKMIKTCGYEGASPNPPMIPCDMKEMTRIWKAIEEDGEFCHSARIGHLQVSPPLEKVGKLTHHGARSLLKPFSHPMVKNLLEDTAKTTFVLQPRGPSPLELLSKVEENEQKN